MTYTLPAALEAIDALVDEMDTVIVVAAQDVMDVYGLDAPFRQKGAMIQPDPLRRKFARMLVERLVHDPDIELHPAAPSDLDTLTLQAEVERLAPAATSIDLPCPRCSQCRVICYRLDNEMGEHMHTHYACTFWGSGQPRSCGWSGWTVPGWDAPAPEGAST